MRDVTKITRFELFLYIYIFSFLYGLLQSVESRLEVILLHHLLDSEDVEISNLLIFIENALNLANEIDMGV